MIAQKNYQHHKVVRLGLIQWQMRSLTNLDALDQAEFSLILFQVTVVILPQNSFTAPLMADFNHLSEAEAIRELAKHTEAVKLKFQEFAISYNINAACQMKTHKI
jgi:hypothetical protein